MKVIDLKAQLEKFESEGKISAQNVEVITAGQKYFIEEVDITTTQVTLNVTRRNYIPNGPRHLLSSLKNASEGAELSIMNIDKKQATTLTGVFYSDSCIELTTEA